MANSAFAVPGLNPGDVVKAQVLTPSGEIQTRLPRVPIAGDTTPVFEIADGETIQSVTGVSDISTLEPVLFVGGDVLNETPSDTE